MAVTPFGTGSGGYLGQGTSKTAGTTIVLTEANGQTIPAGTLIHITGCWDNIASVTAPVITCSTVGGATATANHATAIGSGVTTTAGAGVWHQCFRVLTTAAIAPGGTIATLTSNQSAVARAAHAVGYTKASETLRGTVATGTSTGGTPSAATTGTALVAGDLVIGSVSYENSAAPTADADTLNGSWLPITSAFTTGGNAQTNAGASAQGKIVTATGAQTYNPTNMAADCIACVYSVQPRANAVPAKITGVVATNQTGQVSVAWAANLDADTYNVYRNGSLLVSGRTASPYIDTTGTVNTSYSYTVSGVNTVAGEGPQSDASSGTPQPTPKAETLTDTFAASAGWSGFNYSITGGQLQIVRTPGTVPSPYPTVLGTANSYDFKNSWVAVEMVSIPASGADDWLHFTYWLGGTPDGMSVAFEWTMSGGRLGFLQSGVPGAAVTSPSITYDPVAHRWWRLREGTGANAGGTPGTLYWDTSPDGITWTTQASTTHTMTDAQLKNTNFGTIAPLVNTFGSNTGTGTVLIDNLNLPPAPATITQAAYRFFADDGTEAASTALGTQDTGYTAPVAADVNLQLRTRLQSTNTTYIPATEDFQLQYELNASGVWNNLSAAAPAPIDSYTPISGGSNYFWGNNIRAMGQSMLGTGLPLARVTAQLRRGGSPAGTVRAKVYAHTGTYGSGGTPTGAALATSTTSVAASTLPTVGGVYTAFDFDGSLVLANGTPYFLVVESDTYGDVSNDVQVGASSTAPAHAGNRATFRTSWAADATDDMDFAAYSPSTTPVVYYDSANLTDGAATTNRLTGGTGTFVAGEVTETGQAVDVGWSANNFTELVYSLTLRKYGLADGDVVRFRVLRNGSTTGITYTQTPTITASKVTGLPKTATVIDTFDSQINPAVWAADGTPPVWENGRVKAETVSAYSGIVTSARYDLRESSVSCRMIPPAPATTRETYLMVKNAATDLTEVMVTGAPGSQVLILRTWESGIKTDSYFPPYDPVAHAWVRFRLVGTTFYLDGSPDGITWTQLHSRTTTNDLSAVTIGLGCGQWGSEADTQFAYFDNVNAPGLAPVTLAQTWNVRTAQVKTLAQTWNVRAQVGVTLTQSWNVKAYTVVTLVQSWNVRALATKTLAESWNVRVLAAVSTTQTWNVRALTSTTLAQSWNIRAFAVVTSAQSWNVRSVVGKTLAESWNVRALATATSVQTWNVRTLVVTTLSETWNVGGAVLVTLAQTWNIRALATATLVQGWDIHAVATHALVQTWNVRVAVAPVTLAQSWNVRVAVGVTLAQTWNVRVLVLQTRSESWNVRAAVLATLAETWNVRALATATLAQSWRVRVVITPVTLAQTWNVRALAVRTLIESWNIRDFVGVTLIESWNVRSSATTVVAQVVTSWNIRALTTETLAASWNVHVLVGPKTLAESWNVRAFAVASSAQTWNVRALTVKTLAENWAVRTPVVLTLAESWSVHVLVLRTLVESWNILAAAGWPKVWNGTTWVKKPAKVWTGSTWIEKPVKVWTGTAWKTVT